MVCRQKKYFLFLFGLGLTLSWGQTSVKDSIRAEKNIKITAFPIVYYLPDTGLGFGGLGIATFRFKSEQKQTRPSSVQLGVSYTTKNQFLLFIPMEMYWKGETWWLKGELGYYKYFYNFYGVGIHSQKKDLETYATNFPRLRVAVLRKIASNLSIGLGYQLDVYSKPVFKEDGQLISSNVIGKDGGTISNIGIVASYDSRDHIFYPTKGVYIQGKLFTSSKLLGASFVYSKYELDMRYYRKILGMHVVAANIFLSENTNKAPFLDLNYLGSKRTRGIMDRRYQDDAQLSVTLEYRFPISGRFGGTFFGSSGTVSSNLGNAFSSAYKNSGGAGLRYIINKKEGVRIRIDYGISNEGGNFYFTINEAF